MGRRILWLSLSCVVLWFTRPVCSGNDSALLPATNNSSSNSSHLTWTTSTNANNSKTSEHSIKDRNETKVFVNSSIFQPSPSSLSSAVVTGSYLIPSEIFGNRILIMALSFDVTHSDAMNELLSEYLSMCEGGWNVTGTNSTILR